MKSLPRGALKRWRDHVARIKAGSMFDNLRAQQLKNSFGRIAIRTLRGSHNSVVLFHSSIGKVFDKLDNYLRNKIKNSLNIWEKFAVKVAKGELLDGIRAQKLNAVMMQIPLRVLKDSNQRIMGNGDKITGALRALESRFKAVPRDALKRWREFVNRIKSGSMFDNLRAQKLRLHLERIPKRSLKAVQNTVVLYHGTIGKVLQNLDTLTLRWKKQALRNWERYSDLIRYGHILDNVRAQQLKNLLQAIPHRTVKDAQQRIFGQGDKVTGALRELDFRMKNIPRDALKRWKDYVDRIKRGQMFDNLRAQKLKDHLQKITVRTVKGAQYSVVLFHNKIGKVFHNLDNILNKLRKDALRVWEKYAIKCQTGDLLSGIKAQKLKIALQQIPYRTSKDTLQRLIGQGDKVTGALRELDSRIKNIPRDALKRWKDYVARIKSGNAFDNFRAQKLKFHLGRIPIRSIRAPFNTIVLLESKVSKIFDKLDEALKTRRRDALKEWDKYVAKCHRGDLLDGIRTQKLKNAMSRVPMRTLKDA